MRHQPVDVLPFEPVRREGLVHDATERPDRPPEHLVALHSGPRRALRGVVVSVLYAALDIQEPLATAVGMQMGAHHARLGRRLENHRARTVAEQDAGPAVVPVKQARVHVGADYERAVRAPRPDELFRDTEGVDETRTHCLDVECGAALGSETRLQPARGGRVDPIRGGGTDHDEVEVGSGEPGRFEGPARRSLREIARRLPGSGDTPLPDSGPLTDPRVGRIDGLRELVVGEHPLGEIAPGAGDTSELHSLGP